MARIIGIAASSVSKLVSAYRPLKEQLDALDEEGRAHVKGAAATKVRPDREVLKRLYWRRLSFIRGAMAKLQANLREEEWQRVQYYIDGTFRNYIKGSPLQ